MIGEAIEVEKFVRTESYARSFVFSSLALCLVFPTSSTDIRIQILFTGSTEMRFIFKFDFKCIVWSCEWKLLNAAYSLNTRIFIFSLRKHLQVKRNSKYSMTCERLFDLTCNMQEGVKNSSISHLRQEKYDMSEM